MTRTLRPICTSFLRVSALAVCSGFFLVPTVQAAPPAKITACRPAVHNAVLPVWARGGFSESRPVMPQALGRSGNIVAILWADRDPLVSPPYANRNNKILWVARLPWGHATLWIRAQRMVGARTVGQPVSRVVKGGPGPSIVNLPESGCWRLGLRWSGRSDSLDLRYAERS